MQKIKVSKVESKPTSKGGTMVALYDDKNTRFSGFLKELQDVHEGDTVEVEIQVDGKYLNITGVKSIVKGTVDSAPQQSSVSPSNERASIEAQTVFKGIMDVLSGPNAILVPASISSACWKYAACKLKDYMPEKSAREQAIAKPIEPKPEAIPNDDFDKTFGKPEEKTARSFASGKAFTDWAYEAYKMTPSQFPLAVIRHFNAKQYAEAAAELEKEIAATRAAAK